MGHLLGRGHIRPGEGRNVKVAVASHEQGQVARGEVGRLVRDPPEALEMLHGLFDDTADATASALDDDGREEVIE